MKKTKAQLEEELKEAKETIRYMNEMMEKSGSLHQQIEDVEKQIEVIETEASMDIVRIIELCEEKTGREFTFQHGGQVVGSDLMDLTRGNLTAAVRLVARKAAGGKYDWDEACDFKKWAEPLFMDEWNRTRKEQS